MSRFEVKPARAFDLTIDSIAPDKSISHRCAMFSLLSDKPSRIVNFLSGEDTMNSLNIAAQLGATVVQNGNETVITPAEKITEPSDVLDCGNAGTGIRLYAGLLASQDGLFVLSGDEYLRRRPMKRITRPLRDIGAKIDGRDDANKAPLVIRGQRLNAFEYTSKIASAQVKSAMILAALRSEGDSFYTEPELTRDHTERMLLGMGAKISTDSLKTRISPIEGPLDPLDITVPADPSSGFFFAVAAAIVPGSRVVLKNMMLNPTRIEAYKVLQRMGAKVQLIEHKSTYDSVGDIIIEHAPLQGVIIEENISWLIDELPALSVAMCCAEGPSTVKNAEELRVKESDRIKSVVDNMVRCGLLVEEFADGYTIFPGTVKKTKIHSYGDHRIAMSFAVAGLLNGMEIEDTDCIVTSFPNFVSLMKNMTDIV